MFLQTAVLLSSALAAPFSIPGNHALKQAGAPWGLARLSHADYVFHSSATTFNTDDNNAYFYYGSSKPVTIYMLDTGIDVTHTEFGGRAIWGTNIVGSGTTDDNGHGTHLAGIAAGGTKGVARNATIVSVKILDSQRLGTVEDFDKAVDWVIEDLRSRGGKGIINYSALGTIADVRARAVLKAVNSGIFVVNAGGNNADNACNYGPANLGASITGFLVVAALNYTNAPAIFSNTGPCIGVWAPGVNIQSSLPGNAYGYMDGTSNAAAFVTGLVAYIWGQNPDVSLRDMHSLVQNANPHAVAGPPSNTTESIVYNYYFS